MEKTVMLMEIRYEPDSQFFDSKGRYIYALKESMGLNKWELKDEDLELFSENKQKKVFFTYKHFGIVMVNPETNFEFCDAASKLIREIYKISFMSNQKILRIGLRTKRIKELDMKLEQFVEHKTKLFYNDTILGLLSDSEIIDIGISIDAKDDVGSFSLSAGPMEKEQAIEMFKELKDEDIPDFGFFSDIDYYSVPKRVLSHGAIVTEINAMIRKIDKRDKECRNHLMEE